MVEFYVEMGSVLCVFVCIWEGELVVVVGFVFVEDVVVVLYEKCGMVFYGCL